MSPLDARDAAGTRGGVDATSDRSRSGGTAVASDASGSGAGATRAAGTAGDADPRGRPGVLEEEPFLEVSTPPAVRLGRADLVRASLKKTITKEVSP